MGCFLTLTLLFFGLCIPFSYHFHYVNLQMNWTDAQSYCRKKYIDLATIGSMEDINRLNRPPLSTTAAWIGLRDDPQAWKGRLKNDTNSWRWSATGQSSKTGYEIWHTGQPDNVAGNEYCGLMNDGGTWSDANCGLLSYFVCYKETTNSYVYVQLLLTWFDAQAHCRAYYTDLATIESSTENTYVYQAKPKLASVWFGLYRKPWAWSNKSNSSFRNWINGEPNNTGLNQFCVSEDLQHKWFDDDCTIKRAFICQEDEVHTTVVKIKLQTDADLTDPTINTQILQQLSALVASQGPAEIKLRWKVQPKK